MEEELNDVNYESHKSDFDEVNEANAEDFVGRDKKNNFAIENRIELKI